MKSIKTWIEKFIQGNRKSIFKYYERCDSYFIDLVNSKGVLINSNINFESIEESKKIIYVMIDFINSGLITIGFPSKFLGTPSEIYDKFLKNTIKNYKNYLDVFNFNLKNYINTHLFLVLLELLADIDSNKLENLDLFDLIPQGFLKNLKDFKKKNPISKEDQLYVQEFIRKIESYFDTSTLKFKVEDFELILEEEVIDESNILQKLKLAREESLGVLKNGNNAMDVNTSQLNLTHLEAEPIKKQEKFKLLKYFQNFSTLSNDIIANFNIPQQNFDDIVVKNYKQCDLEDLFYIVSIYKIIGRKIPLTIELIENVVRNFVNGKIFSTGKYHIPNPFSIFYGLALFSQLESIHNSTVIDLLDIEMNLENELAYFNPKNTYLNFYILMSLKLLERSGGTIKNKGTLLDSLMNYEIETIEDFKPYNDLLFYIASMKTISSELDVRVLRQKFDNVLRECILINGSVNNNLTDTARTILIFHMLGVNKGDDDIISTQYDYLLKNLTFFNNETNNQFNWNTNKIALKVELRMLFWSLLAFA